MRNKKTTNQFDLLYKTQNNMTDSTNGFRKEGLEFLKKRYKKTTDDFIRATYPKKDQANMRVKISRLINRDPNAPGYFDSQELAVELSKFFNEFRTNGDQFISANYFLGMAAYIDVVGQAFDDGRVALFSKKDIKKCAVPVRYTGCQGIITKTPSSNGLIRIFKPRNNIYTGADSRYGICQDKKSKVIHIGYLQPNSNGRYDVQDRSWSTGKVNLPNIATDITPSWTSRIETELYPSYWDY